MSNDNDVKDSMIRACLSAYDHEGRLGHIAVAVGIAGGAPALRTIMDSKEPLSVMDRGMLAIHLLGAHELTHDNLADTQRAVIEAAERRGYDRALKEMTHGAVLGPMCDLIVERHRQIAIEGWTPEHDDKHQNSELVRAAACYALYADAHPKAGEPPMLWPWAPEWWKPTDYRRDLVKAGALIAAEIARLDRKEARGENK